MDHPTAVHEAQLGAGVPRRVRWKYRRELQRPSPIFFDTEVVRLFEFSFAGGHWELICKSVLTGESITRPYLYVIVAVGVYDEPSIPRYEGLATWIETWKDSVSHAKTYRDPEAFKGKVSSGSPIVATNQSSF